MNSCTSDGVIGSRFSVRKPASDIHPSAAACSREDTMTRASGNFFTSSLSHFCNAPRWLFGSSSRPSTNTTPSPAASRSRTHPAGASSATTGATRPGKSLGPGSFLPTNFRNWTRNGAARFQLLRPPSKLLRPAWTPIHFRRVVFPDPAGPRTSRRRAVSSAASTDIVSSSSSSSWGSASAARVTERLM